jgi:hypothetical protein
MVQVWAILEKIASESCFLSEVQNPQHQLGGHWTNEQDRVEGLYLSMMPSQSTRCFSSSVTGGRDFHFEIISCI